MPEPKFPRHPRTNDTPVMKHTDIRAGSKRSEAENDNPNVTPIRDSQPDDPGEGTGAPQAGPGETIGGGPKRDTPDTAGASIADEVERNARREALKEAVIAGLFAASSACIFIGLIWGIALLAG